MRITWKEFVFVAFAPLWSYLLWWGPGLVLLVLLLVLHSVTGVSWFQNAFFNFGYKPYEEFVSLLGPTEPRGIIGAYIVATIVVVLRRGFRASFLSSKP